MIALLVAMPVFACSTSYCAQQLAPADLLTLPANAQALIAAGRLNERYGPEGTDTWRPWIHRIDADGGIQDLMAAPPEWQPVGLYGNATLFLPGSLSPGERFRLESSKDCSGPALPVVEVLVGEAAPIPERVGDVFSPPSIRIEPTGKVDCGTDELRASRELFLDLDESVRPWLSVARVNLEVNGVRSSTAYGGLARGFDGGSRVLVTEIQRMCRKPLTGEPSETVESWPVRLELELPGVSERPPAVELEVEMDCRPSCSSVAAAPWLVGALFLIIRRRTLA